MYIIVAGGGQGRLLPGPRARSTRATKFCSSRRTRKRADIIANELGNVVLRGNADEASTLAEAGAAAPT